MITSQSEKDQHKRIWKIYLDLKKKLSLIYLKFLVARFLIQNWCFKFKSRLIATIQLTISKFLISRNLALSTTLSMINLCFLVTNSLYGFLLKTKCMTFKTICQQFSFGQEANLIPMESMLWMFSILQMTEVLWQHMVSFN